MSSDATIQVDWRRLDAEDCHIKIEWKYLQAGQEKKAAVLFTRFVLNISNWRCDL